MSDLDPTPEMSVGCVSDLRLDRLIAGELGAEERSALQAHLSRCETCSARHAQFAQQWHAFPTDGPDFATLAARVRERRAANVAPARSRARAIALASGFAVAAATVLALVPVATRTPPPAPPSTRSKGAPHIGYFVKRGEAVREGTPGTALHPGDRIRFVTSTGRSSYLALLNRDDRGVSVYYPTAGSTAAPVPGGSGVPLEFSVELDDYLGRERVFALFCDAPFAVEPLRAELQAHGALVAPAGCSLTTIDLHKEPAQ